MESHARVALAGEIAQERYDPDSVEDFHGERDRCRAFDLIGYLTESDRELEAWLNLLSIQAEQQVAKYWDGIEAVAAALLEHRTLSAKQIREVIYQAGRTLTSGADIGPSLPSPGDRSI
jgi:hypothetical protein